MQIIPTEQKKARVIQFRINMQLSFVLKHKSDSMKLRQNQRRTRTNVEIVNSNNTWKIIHLIPLPCAGAQNIHEMFCPHDEKGENGKLQKCIYNDIVCNMIERNRELLFVGTNHKEERIWKIWDVMTIIRWKNSIKNGKIPSNSSSEYAKRVLESISSDLTNGRCADFLSSNERAQFR